MTLDQLLDLLLAIAIGVQAAIAEFLRRK